MTTVCSGPTRLRDGFPMRRRTSRVAKRRNMPIIVRHENVSQLGGSARLSECVSPGVGAVVDQLVSGAAGGLHGLDDLRIRRAAAEIARQVVPDLIVGGFRRLLEQFLRHQHESGRTEAALESAVRHERFLHRMKAVLPGQPFDRIHFSTVDEGGEIQATRYRRAVDDHRAAAAQALAAAFPRTEQREIALQHIDQRVMHIDGGGDRTAVERQPDGAAGVVVCHQASSSGLPPCSRIARSTRSGVSGKSMGTMPSASYSALAIAGDGLNTPVSPTPFAPYGPCSCGTSTYAAEISAGTSRKPGIL